MQESPLVSVLVLNYCTAQRAIACAQSFLEQTIADNLEIIVIDNDSPDGSEAQLRSALESDPRVHVVQTGDNRGFGAGYNTGVALARGKYILLNNPDKLHTPDSLEKLVAKLESDDDIGIIGPKLMHHDGTVRRSPRAFPKPMDVIAKRTLLKHICQRRLRHYLQLDHDVDAERAVDWLAGGCLFTSRALFQELGGFDDQFFLFFEDIDLCRRCHEHGKTVLYYPTVVVQDRKERLSEGGLGTLLTSKIGRIHLKSAKRYFNKWRCA